MVACGRDRRRRRWRHPGVGMRPLPGLFGQSASAHQLCQLPRTLISEASSGVCLSLRAELGEMLLHKAKRQVRVSVAIITALSCDQHASNSLELNGPGQQPHALELTDGRAGCGLHRGGQPPYRVLYLYRRRDQWAPRPSSLRRQGSPAATSPLPSRVCPPRAGQPAPGPGPQRDVTAALSSLGGSSPERPLVPVPLPQLGLLPGSGPSMELLVAHFRGLLHLVRCCVSLPRFLGLAAGTAAAAAGWVPASQP